MRVVRPPRVQGNRQMTGDQVRQALQHPQGRGLFVHAGHPLRQLANTVVNEGSDVGGRILARRGTNHVRAEHHTYSIRIDGTLGKTGVVPSKLTGSDAELHRPGHDLETLSWPYQGLRIKATHFAEKVDG